MDTEGLAADGGGSERPTAGSITQRRKAVGERAFLASLKLGHSVRAAARTAKVSYSEFYRRRERDVEFAKLWEDAENEGIDALEEEARRRAYDGVERAVYYQGEKIGSMRQYSDQLLMFMLKAKRPDKYRDVGNTSVSVTSESHTTIEVRFVDQFRLGGE